jgi:hypothetical protein
MRRAWTVVLMMALLVSGMAPIAVAHSCCGRDMQHNCCRPMAQMLAACYRLRADLSAVLVETGRDGTAPARTFWQTDITTSKASNATVVLSAIQPPGLHAPPVIFRI